MKNEKSESEVALHESEERYRYLFESIDEGFCIVELLFDADEVAEDYRFLEVNPAFIKHTGLEDVIGRRVRELIPTHEKHWFEIYGRVFRTGVPERFEDDAKALGRYYDVYAFRVGKKGAYRVAILFRDITERKRTEDRLRVNESRFAAFFERAGVGISEVSADGRFLRVNETLCRILQRSREELLKLGVADVTHPDDLERSHSVIRELLKTGTPCSLDKRYIRADGSTLWANSRLSRLENEPVSFLAVTSDLTPQREAEAALAADLRDTQRLRELSTRLVSADPREFYHEIMTTGIALAKADGGMVQILDAASQEMVVIESVGFSSGMIDALRVTNGGLSRFREAGVESGRRTFVDFETNESSPSDSLFELFREAGFRSAQSMLLVTRSGRPIGVLSTCWRHLHKSEERELRFLDLLARQAADLIERHRAEEALRDSEEQFRRAIEDAPIPVIMHAEDGQVLQISETWTELTGYTKEDMPSFEEWLDRAYGSGAEALRDHLTHLFVGNKSSLNVELEIAARNGTRRRWSYSASVPGRLRDGRRYIVGMAVDITERSLAETALRKSEADLMRALDLNEKVRTEVEAASRAKDQFLAVLSHELRTPLTPVLMNTLMLQRLPDLHPAVRNGLEAIRRNIQLECHLIDDLLDLTRVTQGRVEITRKPLDLHEAVHRAVEISRADMDRKHQQLTLSLRATHSEVIGDLARLQQIFWNLLKNASKFTPQHGEIRVASHNLDGRIVVEVADSGPGIDPAKLTSIFEAFTQADEAITREFGGLGLGLAIAQAAATAHGGSIQATNEPNGLGAIFSVTLPQIELRAEVDSQI